MHSSASSFWWFFLRGFLRVQVSAGGCSILLLGQQNKLRPRVRYIVLGTLHWGKQGVTCTDNMVAAYAGNSVMLEVCLRTILRPLEHSCQTGISFVILRVSDGVLIL